MEVLCLMLALAWLANRYQRRHAALQAAALPA